MVHLCDQHGVSQQRACDVLETDRSRVRSRGIWPDDAELRKAVKDVAAERRRSGNWHLHILLERQGIHMNQKKLRRLYRERGLHPRKRDGRKRALGSCRPRIVPETINEPWSLCRLRNVSPRGFGTFRSRPASHRRRTDMVVLAHAWEKSRLGPGRYGPPRMTEELKAVGVDVGHWRVGRLMRENTVVV